MMKRKEAKASAIFSQRHAEAVGAVRDNEKSA